MPSAEETTYLIEVMPDAGLSQDSFTSRDVDALVSRIKENLRLSSLKSRSSLAHKMRPSPYRLPSRSWADPDSSCELCSKRTNSESEQQQQQQQQQQPGQQTAAEQRKHCHNHHHRYRRYRKAALVRSKLDDSYERFQALLRKGALIKEAVKRLQPCPEDNDEEDDDDVDDVDEVEVSKSRATSTSATSTTLDSMDDEEYDELASRTSHDDDDFFYRRKRFYYDSEDEPLPPVYQPLDL